MSSRGKLIVIDGSDGSGKTTQYNILVNRLRKENHPVELIDFPRYKQPSSWFVTEYLNGRFGSVDEVDPYQCSVFYALNRYAAAEEIERYLNDGKLVIAGRYVTANMGHQGAKIDDLEERAKFFKWLYNFEYEIMKIPKPDLNIILHVPFEVSQKLIEGRDRKSYIIDSSNKDIHEKSPEHLRKAEQVYLKIAKDFDDMFLVECIQEGELLNVETIHEKIWQLLKEKKII